MFQSMNFHLIAFAIGALVLSGCEKEDYWRDETPASPALGAGDCEYKKTGLEQSVAVSEMNRIRGILLDETIGGTKIEVKKAEVFPTHQSVHTGTGETKVSSYGYHVVYSCSQAAIVTEEKAGFYDGMSALYSLDKRIEAINATPGLKVIHSYTRDYVHQQFCNTCKRWVTNRVLEGGQYVDRGYMEEYSCNCNTVYHYSYFITYAKVNSSPGQELLLKAHSAAKAMSGAASVQDTLRLIRKFTPQGGSDDRRIRDWQFLLERIDRAAIGRREYSTFKK